MSENSCVWLAHHVGDGRFSVSDDECLSLAEIRRTCADYRGMVEEHKGRIRRLEERQERAQEALHRGNASCSGEGKQAAIVAALDALGWQGPERMYLPNGCGEGCDACPPPKDCPIRGGGILAGCVGDVLADQQERLGLLELVACAGLDLCKREANTTGDMLLLRLACQLAMAGYGTAISPDAKEGE